MEQRGKLKSRWSDGHIKGIKRRICYAIQPPQNYISLAHTMQYLNGTVENSSRRLAAIKRISLIIPRTKCSTTKRIPSSLSPNVVHEVVGR